MFKELFEKSKLDDENFDEILKKLTKISKPTSVKYSRIKGNDTMIIGYTNKTFPDMSDIYELREYYGEDFDIKVATSGGPRVIVSHK